MRSGARFVEDITVASLLWYPLTRRNQALKRSLLLRVIGGGGPVVCAGFL